MSPRRRKYAKRLPACWPALLHDVAATLEHDAVLGRETFVTVIDVGANKPQFAVDVRTRRPAQADLRFRRPQTRAGAARP